MGITQQGAFIWGAYYQHWLCKWKILPHSWKACEIRRLWAHVVISKEAHYSGILPQPLSLGSWDKTDNSLTNLPSGPLRETTQQAEWLVGLIQYDLQSRLFIHIRSGNFYSSLSPFSDCPYWRRSNAPRIRTESAAPVAQQGDWVGTCP